MSIPNHTPTTISPQAKQHLLVLISNWKSDNRRVTLSGALSDLILATPINAPYPTPANGQGND